ncbi:MAG TPA: hypothetical protein VML55_07870 [Planctomycetaceae bacterium]|nr:hypothetical protein [Planctomycetaceae bacterium]
MLKPLRHFSAAAFASAALILVAGCGGDEQPSKDGAPGTAQTGGAASGTPGAGHDPHDVPLTEQEIEELQQQTAGYGDAVKHIQQFRDTIRQETTEGAPAKAHRALDKLDLVLERLPEIARDSGVPRDRWEEVNTTAQDLRELFNQVHANIDSGKAPDYASVGERIDRGVDALAAIEPPAAAN